MGLDMYLIAEKYLGGGWKHAKEDDKVEFRKALDAVGLDQSCVATGSPSGTISFTVAYWRKANQIHKWFVKNVQDGEDKCHPHGVSREQLKELRDLCQRVLDGSKFKDSMICVGQTVVDGVITDIEQPGKVIDDPALAHLLLPTVSGFFFGSTDYDEWYVRDLENTVKMIDAILSNPKLEDFSFKYRSSW